MKGYVGTVFEIPESVKMAERCVETGKQFGVDVEIIQATYRDNVDEELKKLGLKRSKFDTSYSNADAVVANFCTQYRTWMEIFYSREPGIVLEHDAVFTADIPEIVSNAKADIINLGKPSYGNFRKATQTGIFPMFSKPGGYIPGAHGYYISVAGANQLIEKARSFGAAPCDLFLCKTNFPSIAEIYPWVIEAHDEFTTIQVEKGCIAKHNYGDDFTIL